MDDLSWCIEYLRKHNAISFLPEGDANEVFRALMNITMPAGLSEEFYDRQDSALQRIVNRKNPIDLSTFPSGISLFKGDITNLKADAVVNACNSKMLGCFVPGHYCVDNAIHSFAGLQVRRDMMEIMRRQGHDEPNGGCKVTSGYNLPSRYILHTVGPIYSGLKQDEFDLENSYKSCLKEADKLGLSSIAFCSISTGLYGFPIQKACQIAIKTVKKYLQEENQHLQKVVFDLFSDFDYYVYRNNL